jgi:hypothetical protein
MALFFNHAMTQGTMEVILKQDSAVDCSDEAYAEYCKTLDESMLGLKDPAEATRFVLKKTLNLKNTQAVRSKMMKYEGGEMKLDPTFIIDEVRASLVDIKNPASVPEEYALKMKKNGDGTVDDDLMVKLIQIGAVENLYNVRSEYLKSNAGVEHLKNG